MTRKDALVEAAFRRVAEQGFEGLRLRQVAEDVGIDHSTLHHHFATKQALILAVAAWTTRQFWRTAPEADDPARALHDHLDGLRLLMGSRPDLFVVTAELDLRARRDPAVAQALDALESGWRERLVALFDRGLADGTWTGLDPTTATELVIAAVKGLRHVPQVAGVVFDSLEALLTRKDSSCTS